MRIPAGGNGDAMRERREAAVRGGGGGGGASPTSWPIPGSALPNEEALILFM
jgi:hypothetical protein